MEILNVKENLKIRNLRLDELSRDDVKRLKILINNQQLDELSNFSAPINIDLIS